MYQKIKNASIKILKNKNGGMQKLKYIKYWLCKNSSMYEIKYINFKYLRPKYIKVEYICI